MPNVVRSRNKQALIAFLTSVMEDPRRKNSERDRASARLMEILIHNDDVLDKAAARRVRMAENGVGVEAIDYLTRPEPDEDERIKAVFNQVLQAPAETAGEGSQSADTQDR